MAIADSAAVRPEAPEPVIIALTERITEETLIALASKNPEYRFETTADGRLVVSPLTGFFASGGEADLGRQIGNWNAEKRLGRVTSSSGGFTLADGAIKGPDAAFVSHERIATLSPKREKRAFRADRSRRRIRAAFSDGPSAVHGREMRRVCGDGERCRGLDQPPRSKRHALS